MAFSCSQRPGPRPIRPNTSSQTFSNSCSTRTLPITALRASDRQQQHLSSSNASPAASMIEDDAAAASDASPLCVLLPNGRQFQIQMVVRRGGQPEWAFTGMNGLSLPSSATVVEPASSSSTAAAAAVPGQPPAADLSHDMLPWSFSEQQQQQQQSAALQAAAKSLSALFHAPAAAEPEVKSGSAGTHPQQQQQQQQQRELGMLQWQLSQEEEEVEEETEGVEASAVPDEQSVVAAAAAAAATAGTLAAPPAGAGIGLDVGQQQQQQEVLLLPWSMSEPEPAAAAAAASWSVTQQQQQQQQQQQPSLLHARLHEQLLQYQQQPEQPLQQQQQQQQDSCARQKQLNRSEASLLQRIEAAEHPWKLSDIVKLYHDAFTPAVTSAVLVKLESLVRHELVAALLHDPDNLGLQPVSKRQRQVGNVTNSVSNSVSDKDRAKGLGVVAYYQWLMGLDANWQPLPKEQQQQREFTSSSSSSRQQLQSSISRSREWAGPMHHSIQEDEEEEEQGAAAATAAAVGARSTNSSSSSGSSSSSKKAAAAAAEPDKHARRMNFRLKLLVRCYLRCIDVLEAPCGVHSGSRELHGQDELHSEVHSDREDQQQQQQQLSHVSNAALVAAARLASRIVGKACPVHTWWVRARGHLLLGEASLRFKDGTLSAAEAIDIAYRYKHTGHCPEVLLQPLLKALRQQQRQQRWQQQQQQEEGLLEKLNAHQLCHLTFCVVDTPQLRLHPEALLAAVLHRLQNPTLVASAKAYDIVMLLRHMCVLSPTPPQSLEQGLMPLVVFKMPSMKMQELSTLLHVAIEWQLSCRQQLAEAVATLVAAALGVQLQQQQQQDAGSNAAAAGPACEQQQDQFDGSSSSSPAASMQQAVMHVQQHAASHSKQQQRRQQQQQVPLTAADPVILLHRFRQCNYQPAQPLLLPLLRAVGPRLHQISLLQAGLLFRAMELHWRDAEGCRVLLATGLEPWMVPKSARASAGSSSSNSSSSSKATAVSLKLFQLPYWQLKSLIVAAGRFGPLEAEAAAAAAAPGLPQQQQQQCGAEPGSSSSIAKGFICGLLDQLSHPSPAAPRSSSSSSSSSRPSGSGASSSRASWQATPTVVSEWRADMVLALFWAAARLGVSPEPLLLQQGCGALAARMHRQVGSHEVVHLVWAAGVLGLKEPAFLQVLCGSIVKHARSLHPRSIASAAWALSQLRCPSTTALAALSDSLLSSTPLPASHQQLRQRTWHREDQQQQHQQQQRQQQHDDYGSSSSSSSSRATYKFRSREKLLPTWQEQQWDDSADSSSSRSSRVSSSSSSSSGSSVLSRNPRLRLLKGPHLAKLAGSCVLSGWAPPQLLLLLAVRAVELMHELDPASLSQLMWAYASASCRVPHLTHAAAARAAELAKSNTFSSSRQPLALLGSFRALGLSSSQADGWLALEVTRLKQQEAAAAGERAAAEAAAAAAAAATS